jgi:hypothetical protein
VASGVTGVIMCSNSRANCGNASTASANVVDALIVTTVLSVSKNT